MGKIEIKGPIISDSEQWIYDWFEIPATSPSKVNKALSQMKDGEEVEATINSPGGSSFSGSEIFTAVKSYPAKTVGKIVGIGASAASVIAMGFDELLISPTAQLMIHRASTEGWGNKHDFEHIADVLSGIDESIANAYLLKTGLPVNELLQMMSKETWLNAQKAKELGFVDGIMFENETTVFNSLTDSCGMLPQAVIDKVRTELKGKITEPDLTNEIIISSKEIEIAKAKLKLTTVI